MLILCQGKNNKIFGLTESASFGKRRNMLKWLIIGVIYYIQILILMCCFLWIIKPPRVNPREIKYDWGENGKGFGYYHPDSGKLLHTGPLGKVMVDGVDLVRRPIK